MSFPQFSRLPPELQLKIWAFSLPAPRVVDLFAIPVSETLQPRSGIKTPPSKSTNATASTSIWIRTFIERIHTSPRSLVFLHICPEARRLALKRFRRINADKKLVHGDASVQYQCLPPAKQQDGLETMFVFASLKGERPYALLDPKSDVLFLQDPPRMVDAIGGHVISSLEILLRWLGSPIICSLMRLAIPYYTWRKTRNAGALKLLLEFRGLKHLYVSFLGSGVEGKQGKTWSDIVGGLWSHVEEVEEEVKADIEGLKRTYPEWKAPALKVIRHRGVLLEEFEG